MSVLLVLTLIYVAVLVLALASGLIAICYFLNGARANLKQIASGLEQVNKNVEPLKSALTAANEGLGEVLKNLRKTGQNLDVAELDREEKRAGGMGA